MLRPTPPPTHTHTASLSGTFGLHIHTSRTRASRNKVKPRWKELWAQSSTLSNISINKQSGRQIHWQEQQIIRYSVTVRQIHWEERTDNILLCVCAPNPLTGAIPLVSKVPPTILIKNLKKKTKKNRWGQLLNSAFLYHYTIGPTNAGKNESNKFNV